MKMRVWRATTRKTPSTPPPQVHKLQNPNSAMTPFDAPSTPGAAPGIALWGNGIFSPAPNSLMKTIRRARLHKNTKRSRKSSSSASGSGLQQLELAADNLTTTDA